MRPAARVQAAIELLDLIIMAARDGGAAADNLIRSYCKERRYIGSGDRRAIRTLVYKVIRHFGEIPESGRAAMASLADGDTRLAALFDGSDYGPAKLQRSEPRARDTGPISPWLSDALPIWLDHKDRSALLDRAPLGIRYYPQRTDKDQLQSHFPDMVFPNDHMARDLPFAAALPTDTRIEDNPLYRTGALEVQDWGSQAIVSACKGKNRTPLIVDMCAGAGGKTLALAAQVPDSHIIASDTVKHRLAEMQRRVKRIDIKNITPVLLDTPEEQQQLATALNGAHPDIILIDAPCSGSGTWRRNPEGRWRLTRERLQRLTGLQARLLDIAAAISGPETQIIYAVCSLLPAEGAGQLAEFLSRNSNWRIAIPEMQIGRPVGPNGMAPRDTALGLCLTPLHDATDGFFFGRLIAHD